MDFPIISKAKIKLLSSLQQKKYRKEQNLFIAESKKLIEDFINSGFVAEMVISSNTGNLISFSKKGIETYQAKAEDLKKISALKTPADCIAAFRIPEFQLNESLFSSDLSLVLDRIQNPGNLGTIIRLADWFGIKQLICSPETADVFNPKVVQASMGSLARVQIVYKNLKEFLSSLNSAIPVMGAYLEGDNIYNDSIPATGLVILGNEGQGIHPDLEKYVNQKIFIPPFPDSNNKAESLNVGIAGAIICSELRRKH